MADPRIKRANEILDLARLANSLEIKRNVALMKADAMLEDEVNMAEEFMDSDNVAEVAQRAAKLRDERQEWLAEARIHEKALNRIKWRLTTMADA